MAVQVAVSLASAWICSPAVDLQSGAYPTTCFVVGLVPIILRICPPPYRFTVYFLTVNYLIGVDDPDTACGLSSDCINLMTQVECLEDDCRCRGYCRNQRYEAPFLLALDDTD